MTNDQDAFLNAALGLEPDPVSDAVQPDKTPDTEAKADTGGQKRTEADSEADSTEEVEQTDVAAVPGKLTAADETFAFEWLARGGVSRADLNSLIDERPEMALALAKQFKQNQDTIARSRREASAVPDQDTERPSTSAPSQTGEASPEEHRRSRWLELVRDEFGDEDAQALERSITAQQQPSGGPGQVPDVQVLMEVGAARERLVASGHDELRDQAEFGRVLVAADVLRSADPDLSVRDAIERAATLRNAGANRGQAATQERSQRVAASQPLTARTRSAPIALTKEQAIDKWLDARLEGDSGMMRELEARYKINVR